MIATKYASLPQLKELCEAGVVAIGENRIQDAVSKFEPLEDLPSFRNVEKYFLGHLQRNKAKLAVKWFDVIASVDSLRIAEVLNQQAQKQQKNIRIYIEVNVGDEPQKYGVKAEDLESLLAEVVKFPHLHLEGLMTVLPFFDDLEKVRPYAREMKKVIDDACLGYPMLKVLSIGMSHDMRIAIEEGATEVRIGRRIFAPAK